MDTNPTMELVRSQSAHSPPEKGVAKAKSKKSPLKKAKKPILKRKGRLTSEDFDAFESHSFVSSTQKNQLELYLDEPRLPRNEPIDVLEYWRAHNYRYPELASMARNVLSIPISTVASESAFSVGGRVIDKYRSSLKPNIVEALICSRDWLFGGEEIDNMKLDDVIEDIMNLNLDNDLSESVGCSSSVINVEP